VFSKVFVKGFLNNYNARVGQLLVCSDQWSVAVGSSSSSGSGQWVVGRFLL